MSTNREKNPRNEVSAGWRSFLARGSSPNTYPPGTLLQAGPSHGSPSFFPNAQHVVIGGGTFMNVMGNAQLQVPNVMAETPGEKGFKILHDHVAHSAFHNSDDRHDAPRCHPETRQVLRQKIMNWIKDPQNLQLFLWLFGPAGAGKTAIAQTIAETCEGASLIAVSFFFSRTAADRNEKSRLVSTLAYQLALSIPLMQYNVGKAIEADPSIWSRSLETQLKTMIVDPLNKVKAASKGKEETLQEPILIIIDGLDECESDKPESQSYFLESLCKVVGQLAVPVHFMIASRPELAIRTAFSKSHLNSRTVRIALDDDDRSSDDIETFLRSKFQEIRERHPSSAYLPASWPTPDEIKRLVYKSSCQFIYASTIIKYIESPDHRPTDRLKVVLGLSPAGRDVPFAALDALYLHILSTVKDISLPRILEILSFIILSDSPTKTPYELERVFSYRPGDVHILLNNLHAVIHIPLSADSSDNIRLHHTSLGDFLLDRSRAREFYIDPPKVHAHIAKHYIRCTSGHRSNKQDDIHRFLLQCSKAELTQELMDYLYHFNIVAIYFEHNLNLKAGESGDSKPNDLRHFFEWLQLDHELDPERDLLRHHLILFDNWRRSDRTYAGSNSDIIGDALDVQLIELTQR